MLLAKEEMENSSTTGPWPSRMRLRPDGNGLLRGPEILQPLFSPLNSCASSLWIHLKCTCGVHQKMALLECERWQTVYYSRKGLRKPLLLLDYAASNQHLFSLVYRSRPASQYQLKKKKKKGKSIGLRFISKSCPARRSQVRYTE